MGTVTEKPSPSATATPGSALAAKSESSSNPGRLMANSAGLVAPKRYAFHTVLCGSRYDQ
jgi:hypothetical protein